MIVGCDLSSVQIDACVLDGTKPPQLIRMQLGHANEPIIERLRRIPAAIQPIIDLQPDWIVIESSYGRFRTAVRALDKTTGALIASAPACAQIAMLDTNDWRTAIGATTNTKQAGHIAVDHYLASCDLGFAHDDYAWTEHELDAIGIALGWATILEGGAER